MSQLSDLVANCGSTISVGTKQFDVSDFKQDEEGDIELAGFKAARAEYTGMRLPKCSVAGRPGAEVWEVFGSKGKTVAKLAVFQGQILALT